MKPRLPQWIAFHRDIHLMVYRPRGIVTEARVEQIVATLEQMEDAAKQPFNRYTDLSIAVMNLSFEFIFRISLHRRRTYAKYPPAKSAFYVTNRATAQIAKTHAILVDHSPLQVKLFEEVEAAAQWLGVSIEDLNLAP